jgi:universal stress protein A
MSALSVLCPIDFSEASRGALRYAAAIAAYCEARLTVMTAEDPLLASMDVVHGALWPTERARKELASEVAEALSYRSAPLDVRYELAVGHPATEILRVAAAQRANLIVMSSHGLTGVRKLFFGSTTERVLRETTVPVLVTRPDDYGAVRLDARASVVDRILVPVDFGMATAAQMHAAGMIAKALDVPLLLAHVLEPVRRPLWRQDEHPRVEPARRARAEKSLEALVAQVPDTLRAETLLTVGNPAEEIARIARERKTQLIVLGLLASEPAGPRIGSVTFRVLCLTSSLVLSLPPVRPAQTHPSRETSSSDATVEDLALA